MTPKHHLPWIHDETAAFAQAAREHKGVMIDFSAAGASRARSSS